MTTIVYVVTFGRLGAETGEFVTEEAYTKLETARQTAKTFMNAHGGVDRFTCRDSPHHHVMIQWDSDDHSVWLEQLVVRHT